MALINRKTDNLGLTQTGVQSETKCSFVVTKFRYATLWTPILAVLRKPITTFLQNYEIER